MNKTPINVVEKLTPEQRWKQLLDKSENNSEFIRSLSPQRQYLFYGQIFKTARLKSTTK